MKRKNVIYVNLFQNHYNSFNSLQLILPPSTDCLQVPVRYFVITYGLALNRKVIQRFINGYIKHIKDFVNQTFSEQETLARAVQQADKTITKLYDVLELGFDLLASDQPDDQVCCRHWLITRNTGNRIGYFFMDMIICLVKMPSVWISLWSVYQMS